MPPRLFVNGNPTGPDSKDLQDMDVPTSTNNLEPGCFSLIFLDGRPQVFLPNTMTSDDVVTLLQEMSPSSRPHIIAMMRGGQPVVATVRDMEYLQALDSVKFFWRLDQTPGGT